MFEGRKVLWVAGGRDYFDHSTIKHNLLKQGVYHLHDILITGAAKGADLGAEQVWRRLQMPYVGVPAEWDRLGKRAGYVRNELIAQQEPDTLLVFPGGKGTQHAVDLAEEYRVNIVYAEEVR